MIPKLYVACAILGILIQFSKCFPASDQGGGGNCGGGGGNNGGIVSSITSDMYPTPRREECVSDKYAGNIIVKDPYRWMEKPVMEEIKKFYESHNAITRPYLDKSPFRPQIEARFKELNDHPKYYGPLKYGKKYYSFQNTGLQNQDVFYVQDSLNDEPKVFFDPNALSEDGTIALNFDTSSFSYDGLIFAYSLSQNGSDRMKVKFKHVEKGDIYKEELIEVRYTTLQWTRNNKGIFYGRFLGDNPDHESVLNQKLYYHEVGTDQSKDVLVAEFPKNPDYMIGGVNLSDCGKYLIITPSDNDDHNLIYIADLEKINYEIKGKLDLIPIVTKMEAIYEFIANDDTIFTFRTNKDADNYKLITIDIKNPDPCSWKDLVPENKKDVLDSVKAVHEKYMLLNYIQDVKNVLQLHDLKSGQLIKKFDLEIGSIDYISGDRICNEIFFQLETFLSPGIIYRCDLSNCSFDLQIFREIKVKNFDRQNFTTEQVFYKSKDGTKIPMYLIYKNGIQKNASNPGLLYGFGAFGMNLLPNFSVKRLVFIDNLNGVYAVANVRGGGEYGKKWHDDAKSNKKQNTFDDFQAAAEYLIAQKYTSNKLLTINGSGAGGLMVGVCLNQRPDLYGAVVAEAGLFDMLRYNKFTEDGKTWVSEFGSSDNPKEFEYVYKYSPLHNINLVCDDASKQYPATLISTADDSNRIPHASKFISTLQFLAKSQPNQKNPLLLKVGTNKGNGSNQPIDKQIADQVDVMCFIVNAIGIKFN